MSDMLLFGLKLDILSPDPASKRIASSGADVPGRQTFILLNKDLKIVDFLEHELKDEMLLFRKSVWKESINRNYKVSKFKKFELE